MKKIFLLMTIMTSLFFALSIDSNAYTFNNENSPAGITLDTNIIELNGYSLREIFENSLVTQSDLYTEYFSIGSYNEGVYTNTAFGTSNTPFFDYNGLTIGDDYYIRVSTFTNSNNNNDILEIRMYNSISGVTDNILNPLPNITYTLSKKGEAVTTGIRFFHTYNQVIQNDDINLNVRDFYIVNLTDFGMTASSFTTDELDYYYSIYYLLINGIDPTTLYSNGFTQGQLEGYYEGYADGYQDGDFDGYNNGYSDGQEDGYDTGYLDGNVAGLETGYLNGYNDGYDAGVISEVDTQWLLGFVTGTVNVLGVSIIPGISLGVFVFIPLFLGFIGFIFRLGGRRG